MSDYHHYNNGGYQHPAHQHMHLRGQQQQQVAPPPQLAQEQEQAPTTRKRKAAQQQQQQMQQQQQLDEEDEDDRKPSKDKSGGSDFVKKLYNMLEGGQYPDVVSWGVTGDSFVVKDINAFTKEILPLHFKHSNFSSFVRQLNKYDFHKVKAPEDRPSPYGEHSWEFTHPEFRSDMQTSLENIKRKVTAKKPGAGARKQQQAESQSPGPGPSSLARGSGADVSGLQRQLDQLHHQYQSMSQHMNNIQQDYHVVMNEMMNFQRNMVAQDQLMQNLIQYLINLEADQKAATNGSNSSAQTEFQPSQQAQKLISSYTEVARASYDQIADLSRRASVSGSGLPPVPMPPPGFGQLDMRGGFRRDDGPPRNDGYGDEEQSSAAAQGAAARQNQEHQRQQREHEQQQQASANQMHPPQAAGSSTSRNDSPIGQFQPRHFQHPNAAAAAPSGSDSASQPSPVPEGNRRQTYMPGWAVPPRVLLVEDDAVCRKLSSKFLEVFGCQIDVATDGVSAVNKMNMQKYDLVLMDIVMPNLDGVSATSLIRQFDPMTPIISMTSNSGPNDIMTYFSHGMNDILPKPFTKEGLLGMLEKHLIHLKVMQQMAEIPRALGFTDNQIQDALAVSTLGEEGTIMNPFSSMGISDHDYVEMLQGIALEKNGKRELEVVSTVDPREGKRMRFQEGQSGFRFALT
ncbi:hypothetical protein ACM66B_005273 [Microbotryomycetes sp. NB124-2]